MVLASHINIVLGLKNLITTEFAIHYRASVTLQLIIALAIAISFSSLPASDCVVEDHSALDVFKVALEFVKGKKYYLL